MKALLLGDLVPTINTAPLFKAKQANELFEDTLSLFEGNDINLVNLECALTESQNAIKKIGPPLKAPLETAAVMRDIGINYCGLSNNHVFDFGKKGAEDTLNALHQAGIETTGFGKNYENSRKNLVIEKNGEKISIIAVCEHEYSYALENRMGSRPYDEYETIEDIREAKKTSDRVIVLYHGGKEQSRYPSPRLYRLCHAMARNGADVILCQHSHCVGCYEKYNDCHILYGQGNFHFVKQTGLEGWNDGLAVHYDAKTHEIEFTPFEMKETSITLAKGERKKMLMTEFRERSEKLLNGEWKQGWLEFCERNKGGYIAAVCNAGREDSTEFHNHILGHYLDCEAHTDVLRTLFPTANAANEL